MTAAQQSSALPARPRLSRPRRLLAVFAVLALAALITAVLHNVTTGLTEEDRVYVAKILQETGYGALGKDAAAGRDFDEQVRIVAAVQDAVLTLALDSDNIAFDRGREPRDLYELRYGGCYDRSRVIEKVLAYVGLRTRHAAVYSTAETKSSLLSLMTPQIGSHAVTEVETARGWMVVDPDKRWIGLTESGRPFDLAAIKSDPSLGTAPRHAASKAPINRIFRADFAYVIGVFSRHGRFYPPFTPIPDVNWRQIVYNFVD